MVVVCCGVWCGVVFHGRFDTRDTKGSKGQNRMTAKDAGALGSFLSSAVHLHELSFVLQLWHPQLPILVVLWQDQHVCVRQSPDAHLLGLVGYAVSAPQHAPLFVL